MSPLMQTICDYLSKFRLEQYIDSVERDRHNDELDQLRNILSAALPESQRTLLDEYTNLLSLRFHLDTEAMFQAAFAAARELS